MGLLPREYERLAHPDLLLLLEGEHERRMWLVERFAEMQVNLLNALSALRPGKRPRKTITMVDLLGAEWLQRDLARKEAQKRGRHSG